MKSSAVSQAFLPVLFFLSLPALAQQPAPTPLSRLEASIERITKSINADWGIYIKCLETSEEIAIDADRQMDTMSVIKIPLMVEAFRQIEAGKFSLEDKITLKESDKRPGTGIIRSLDAGQMESFNNDSQSRLLLHRLRSALESLDKALSQFDAEGAGDRIP